MNKLLFAFNAIIAFSCIDHTKTRTPGVADSITYPISIDCGKKIVYQRTSDAGRKVYLDTITLTAGELYRKDSTHHPLMEFALSYSEWETISCIVAVDEHDYWGKLMIALIEKDGQMRINFRGQTIHLEATTPLNIKAGPFLSAFKNDSLEIHISGTLESRRIAGSLTGHGNLVLITSDQTIRESIYLVCEPQ
ncbi:hypothetical protein [Pseudochryseolinea flava]|uniref:Uncharacterized protein n=1 Tax=Pseudochryseolinea flava TaxID=2059302 RepID=A0A364XUK4_9BACT|nr:hypothetical protein [Pseudochryseolinea flava]RAV97802.1 hypothetical protein DQQ10_26890 [Pseudochryseolinea flava]